MQILFGIPLYLETTMLLPSWWREGTSHVSILWPSSGEEVRESFLHLTFFKFLQFKICNMPRWHIFHSLGIIPRAWTLSAFINQNYSVRKMWSSFLLHLFVINLYHDRLMDFFPLDYNPVLPLFTILLEFFLHFGYWGFCRLLGVPMSFGMYFFFFLF